jgi:hypothetical protein
MLTSLVMLHDYESIFNSFKSALQDSCALHYPDYDLEWILRTDASMFSVAAVLLMRRKNDDGSFTLLPIAIASSKFSSAATKWTTSKNVIVYTLVLKSFPIIYIARILYWKQIITIYYGSKHH